MSIRRLGLCSLVLLAAIITAVVRADTAGTHHSAVAGPGPDNGDVVDDGSGDTESNPLVVDSVTSEGPPSVLILGPEEGAPETTPKHFASTEHTLPAEPNGEDLKEDGDNGDNVTKEEEIQVLGQDSLGVPLPATTTTTTMTTTTALVDEGVEPEHHNVVVTDYTTEVNVKDNAISAPEGLAEVRQESGGDASGHPTGHVTAAPTDATVVPGNDLSMVTVMQAPREDHGAHTMHDRSSSSSSDSSTAATIDGQSVKPVFATTTTNESTDVTETAASGNISDGMTVSESHVNETDVLPTTGAITTTTANSDEISTSTLQTTSAASAEPGQNSSAVDAAASLGHEHGEHDTESSTYVDTSLAATLTEAARIHLENTISNDNDNDNNNNTSNNNNHHLTSPAYNVTSDSDLAWFVFHDGATTKCQNAASVCPKSLQCQGPLCHDTNVKNITCETADSWPGVASPPTTTTTAATRTTTTTTLEDANPTIRYILSVQWRCVSEPDFTVMNPRIVCEADSRKPATDRPSIVKESCFLEFELDRLLNSSALHNEAASSSQGVITVALVLIACFGVAFFVIKAIVARQRGDGSRLPAYCAMPLKARMKFGRKRHANGCGTSKAAAAAADDNEDDAAHVQLDLGEEQTPLGKQEARVYGNEH